MRAEDEPQNVTHKSTGWCYFPSSKLDKCKRNSRRMKRQSLLRYYVPVLDADDTHEAVEWPLQGSLKPYTSELLLFRKLWTVKNWVRDVNDTEDYFDAFFHNNRYQDACFIGTILLYHFVLLLRPEDGNARRDLAVYSFPRNVSGKICYPEGDLLIVPRRKLKRHKGKLASMCYALWYLPKVMKAVNLLPGPHITRSDKFGESGPSHLREERPSRELLERYKLPQSSATHNILLTDPSLSLSKFFKPLFTSKYIFLECEKTRYAVETLQIAFVVFQQLADAALWSEEYAYALFLIQNMVIIAKYLDILIPEPILKRYYIYTTTTWYYGRVYFHLSLEQNPEMILKEKYHEIYRNYRSWCTRFYFVLESEVKTTQSNSYQDVDRSKLFVFPESKEDCLFRSAGGYMMVKIPTQWTRSCEQHNLVILYSCHKQILEWTDSLRSRKKSFTFKERKDQLYSVLKALCYIKRVNLGYNLRVFLCLLEAKSLFFLSILDVSQLINWFPSGKFPAFTIDSYSFEEILHFSEYIVAEENCEVNLGKRSEILLSVEQEGLEEAVVPFRSDVAELETHAVQSSSALASSVILRDGQRPEVSESGLRPSKSSFHPTGAVLEFSNLKNSLVLRYERFQAYLNSTQYARNLESWSETVSEQLRSQTQEKIEGCSTVEKAGSPVQPAQSSIQPAGSPSQPSKSVNMGKSPVHSASTSSGLLGDSAASVRSKAFVARSTGIIYRISNIPIAVNNMMKANEYRLEGFEFTDTRNSKYSAFGNELSTSTLSNIMIHYVQLQEYETDRKVVWQMTRDFADVLDKWCQEKESKKRFHSGILARVDYPMLHKTFAFMFMGGCLTFYLMYRLAGNRSYLKNARYFHAMMTSHVIKYDLWEPVLKSLAEQAEMRTLLLLDCHKPLRRLPDRCVAVIRSYLHMLPLLYEACIMNQTDGGPINCPRLRVREVVFPFNVDAELVPEVSSDNDITLKILRRAKAYLRKEFLFDLQDGIITVLESAGCTQKPCDEETLQYSDDITVDFTKTAPKYPVLERWSWKRPEGDSRPLCTGDDDCKSAPCTVEGYIADEEKNSVSTFNLEDEPEFLNELVTLNKRGSTNFSTLPSTLSRVRKNLRKVTKKLQNYLDAIPRTGETQYVRISIPGISFAGQSQAVPNHKMKELRLALFMDVLQRSIGYLSDDGLPDDLALCKALLCLDSLLNLEFRISHFLRGSVADLEHFLSS